MLVFYMILESVDGIFVAEFSCDLFADKIRFTVNPKGAKFAKLFMSEDDRLQSFFFFHFHSP